ncbi:MAG: tRNA (guanosine(37)-N1)-methyltransferase TrmD [Christensenellales bacterium]
MRIDVLTLFPEMFDSVLGASILKRAAEAGLLEVGLHNIRDWADNKHKRVDDYAFGGGTGLVMMPQPVFDAVEAVTKDCEEKPLRIYLSPQGRKLDDHLARQLARHEHLVLLCGHYEGVDQRIIENCVDMEISIGDYVLTGGELPAMVLIDAVSRHIPGVLGNEDGAGDESFAKGLLEYPQYTRPSDFRGLAVPQVLLSGHHAQIEKWRRRKSLEKTAAVRPDLLEDAPLTDEEKQYLESLKADKFTEN